MYKNTTPSSCNKSASLGGGGSHFWIPFVSTPPCFNVKPSLETRWSLAHHLPPVPILPKKLLLWASRPSNQASIRSSNCLMNPPPPPSFYLYPPRPNTMYRNLQWWIRVASVGSPRTPGRYPWIPRKETHVREEENRVYRKKRGGSKKKDIEPIWIR